MAFSDTDILSVSKPSWSAGQLFLSWTSVAPLGTWYQVYAARKLVWNGRSTRCSIPSPPAGARINVGTVDDGEQETDFSGSLPGAPANRVRLAWTGGTFEGDDLSGFRIFGEPSPGAGIDYARPLTEIAAYPGGLVHDGWNLGGWDDGGWGAAAGSYQWVSAVLTSGVWSFAVVPIDAAGNEGAGTTIATTIAVPPRPPAYNAAFERLTYTYDQPSKRITLVWLPSPV